MPKRYRSRSRSVDFSRAVKTAKRTGTVSAMSSARRARSYYKLRPRTIATKVNHLYRMIETKEATHKVESTGSGADRIFLPHNNLYVSTIAPFRLAQGAADSMSEGLQANRIGDRITIGGLMITGFLENALLRPKVFYRVMLVKMAKGDTLDRSTFFKNNCSNKMIDQVNTERYTIIAQRRFTIQCANVAPVNVSAAGEPNGTGGGGQGTKVFKMWVPGSKIVSGGNMQFENNNFQPKFFDYKVCILAYDWYGTPQDVNNVGFVNCVYTKCYFKDA